MKLNLQNKEYDITDEILLDLIDKITFKFVCTENGIGVPSKRDDNVKIMSNVLIDFMNAVNNSADNFNIKLIHLFFLATEENFKKLCRISELSEILGFLVLLWKKQIMPHDFFDNWNMADLLIGVIE